MVMTAVIAGAAEGRAEHGRLVASYNHVEGAAEGDRLQARYDVGTERTTKGGVDMDLRMALHFQRRPGVRDSELLRSRFFGDIRRSSVRLHGQFVPWQSTAAGPSSPRENDVRLGLQFSPSRAPHLAFDFNRLERDLAGGRSLSEDRRASVSFARSSFGSELSYRRIDATPAGNSPLVRRTEEWRGGASSRYVSSTLSMQSAYEGLLSDFRSNERRRELWSHGLNLNTTWSPLRRVSLGLSGIGRWGQTDDSDQESEREINEQFASGVVRFRPITSVDLSAIREYRRRREPQGDVFADYYQFDGKFRHHIRTGLGFQSGLRKSATIASSESSAPNSTAYALIDGALRNGMDVRTEVRASRPDRGRERRTQWRRLAQLRTRPRRGSRLDVTWSLDTLPLAVVETTVEPDSGQAAPETLSVAPGVDQRDERWEITGSYDPFPGSTIVGSVRLLDGQGRVDRSERATAVTSSWRTSRRTSLSFNWSHRRTESAFVRAAGAAGGGGDAGDGGGGTVKVMLDSSEITRGVDLTGWLPGEFRLKLSWHGVSASGREGSDTYNATLDKTF